MDNMQDPNFPTGRSGLIAVDKIGNKVLFLDPESFETVNVLSGFESRVRRAADRRKLPPASISRRLRELAADGVLEVQMRKH